MLKSNVESKGFISANNPLLTHHHWEMSDQEINRGKEAVTEAEAMEECGSLACPFGMLFAFIYSSESSTQGGNPQNGLGTHSSVNVEKNAPHPCIFL